MSNKTMRKILSQARRGPVEQYLNAQYDGEDQSSGVKKLNQLEFYVALLAIFSCTVRANADAFPDCSLDFMLNPYSPSSSCLNADNRTTYPSWSTVVAPPCCMDAYLAFSQALAVTANYRGGFIFLDKDEMLACKNTLIQNHSELANCSFNEFSKDGAGNCNNETVDGIGKKLGIKLNTLPTTCNCTLQGRNNLTDQTRLLNNLFSESNATENLEGCGLALMIAIGASLMPDYQWMPCLYACSGYQQSGDQQSGDQQQTGKESTRRRALAGVGDLVGLVAIVLVLLVSVPCWKGIRKRKEDEANTKASDADESSLIRFSYDEILNAMGNFSPRAFLGEGSAGKVYKGKLSGGQFVAIKHICKYIPQAHAFEREIELPSKIRHKNLVSLLGYCDEDGEKYFVYEYCANGNLSQMLLDQQDKVLTWEQRVKIAYDSISGLFCLQLYPNGCMVHRDIKPTNILLTESMEAKIADFELLTMFNIQQTDVFTDVKGTLGYLDPEYADNGRLTCSSDVYSFGIVLLQLLSGRRAIDFEQSNRESLIIKAKRVSQEDPIEPSKYADRRLNGEYNREAFIMLLKLAVLCTDSSSQGRPELSEVYEEIEKALKLSTSIPM